MFAFLDIQISMFVLHLGIFMNFFIIIIFPFYCGFFPRGWNFQSMQLSSAFRNICVYLFSVFIHFVL